MERFVCDDRFARSESYLLRIHGPDRLERSDPALPGAQHGGEQSGRRYLPLLFVAWGPGGRRNLSLQLYPCAPGRDDYSRDWNGCFNRDHSFRCCAESILLSQRDVHDASDHGRTVRGRSGGVTPAVCAGLGGCRRSTDRRILRERTGLSDEILLAKRSRDVHLSPQEALKFGLVHEVAEFKVTPGSQLIQI